MQATRFMRQFFVDGHKVTEKNMTAVALWCGGDVCLGEEDGKRFIRVPVNNPSTSRYTEAYAGLWVVKSEHGRRFSFKIYDEPWLLKEFTMMRADLDNDLVIPDDENYADDVIDVRQEVVATRLRVIPSLPVQQGASPLFMPARKQSV